MPDIRAPLYLVAGGPGSLKVRGPDPLMKAVIERTGVRRPKVAYVGAASGDNAAFRLMIGGMLRKAGAGAVTLAPLCGRRADADEARRVMTECDLVFVSGGDVEEGMRVVAEHRLAPFLRGLMRAGKPFLGVSAGSIMLAGTWVRWRDPENDASAELFPCLGFAPVLCDTHGEGDDWAELKAALLLHPAGSSGYGILSGSALVVEPDGSLAAAGGPVHVFKKRGAGVVSLPDLVP
jgi:cyanophycinase-like exopeptidase